LYLHVLNSANSEKCLQPVNTDTYLPTHTNTVRTSQGTQSVYMVKNNWLMLFREMMFTVWTI